jgi:hypothetical protein
VQLQAFTCFMSAYDEVRAVVKLRRNWTQLAISTAATTP